MNVFKDFTCLQRLHELVLLEKTGTPQQLAKRLGISRATLYVMIDQLKSIDMEIVYSRKTQTFCYKKM
ncbi:MAG: HTH domain-containing protein [Paludibacter sp.]|nr:HTH domain-containing protein [Paludibacter sp.]